jgi:hypothetical protein
MDILDLGNLFLSEEEADDGMDPLWWPWPLPIPPLPTPDGCNYYNSYYT